MNGMNCSEANEACRLSWQFRESGKLNNNSATDTTYQPLTRLGHLRNHRKS